MAGVIKIKDMQHIFHYPINELMIAVQNRSHYREDGQEKQFNDIAIGRDDYPLLKTLIKRACSKVLLKVHALTKTIEDKVFYFDEEIINNEEESLGENLVGFRLMFPDNFNLHIIDSVDEAIEEAVIRSSLSLWLKHKGRPDEQYNHETRDAYAELKEVINYRDDMKLIYNRY